MFSTSLVSKLDKSRLFKLAHPSNIEDILITLSVRNDFKFNDPECYEGYVKWCKDIENNPLNYFQYFLLQLKFCFLRHGNYLL